MDNRLPQHDGEWLDRSKVVRFRFEGREYSGYEGDTISSALWANGLRTLGRSFKYHRPRGIYSLAGHDSNVMVQDGSRTNIRGDLAMVKDAMDLRAVNTLGGVERDFLNFAEWFAGLMPVGFYYKAFHTPRRLFPFYERRLRKIAGLGSIDKQSRPKATPKRYDFCDVLVVGAGPAGLSAAAEAGRLGLKVLLVDEQANIGGSLTYQHRGHEHQVLLDSVTQLDNVEIRTGTQAAGYYGDHWIALVDSERLTKLRANSVIIATGVFEQPAVFHKNDLPGVMLGSAAQRLIAHYGVKPFSRGVVFTANDEGYQVALDLHDAGVDVVAVADPRTGGEPTPIVHRVVDAGIAVHSGYIVDSATTTRKVRGVQGATLCHLDSEGNARRTEAISIQCDGLAVSVGWAPNGGLLYQTGVRFAYNEQVEQFVPANLPDGVFAAGRVNGVFTLDDQLADGSRAALAAAAHLEKYDGVVPPAIEHQGAAPSHPYPIFTHPSGKNFVDFDEDVHLTDFVNAVQEGYDNIELLKRYTTVGMGPSQGKLANMNAVRILAKLTGRSIDETGSTTSRPFYQPVSLEILAGRRFHPHRHTPIHQWHAAHDAEFILVGAWHRPEFYRKAGRKKDDLILAEAQNVRQQVGMVDVGTLGKLEVAGPDAVAFLERTYTGRFAKQPVGKVRYCLALDESGILADDGVIARVADDRFYVTATTSGVLAMCREMQRNAMLWGMNVTLANASGQFAAMNIAGPLSRKVLAPLTDIDLSPEAFGYLGYREGQVAGVAARVMRVGFVGELGYEVHVPAAFGLHVWETLMRAGAKDGIAPFGVEAQRLLRLEKGHIIISQDTDALTHPHEADAAWALGKNKDFYIGQRSLDIVDKQPQERELVGFTFPQGYNGPLPEECHLLIDGDEIIGRVTSIAKRSTLGYPLGLAFIRPDRAKPGMRIRIRVDAGRVVQAAVAGIPFYDPDQLKQKE